jgi:hypothetical protein
MTVRDVTPLERHVPHADDSEIVDVGAAALNETWIFAPLDALANQLGQHGRCSGHAYPLLAY